MVNATIWDGLELANHQGVATLMKYWILCSLWMIAFNMLGVVLWQIVFESGDDPENSVLWSDMFSEPQIDLRDSFPDGSFLSYNTTSEVFDLGIYIKGNGMKMTWKDIKDEFTPQPSEGDCKSSNASAPHVDMILHC